MKEIEISQSAPGGIFPGNKEADFVGTSFHISYDAGKAVMAYTHPKSYKYFIYDNSTALVASLSTILLLICGLPLRKKIFTWALMIIMWLTISSPIIEIVVALWCSVIALLMIGNTFQLAYKWITKNINYEEIEMRKSMDTVHANVQRNCI
ncbi:hypothetical protein H5410_064997 [Solanum commersonii]|uniref:PGG domain-containing protein n=1 Tax=Solanum commersonii TaxID=4109 RepID=A0A9J5VXR9_SOLCO|nr:hypothetical protein H5410_064997 [Solanum commersonii]